MLFLRALAWWHRKPVVGYLAFTAYGAGLGLVLAVVDDFLGRRWMLTVLVILAVEELAVIIRNRRRRASKSV